MHDGLTVAQNKMKCVTHLRILCECAFHSISIANIHTHFILLYLFAKL